jgi:hypothetical protein
VGHKKQSGHGWFARLSEDKKEEYRKKRRMSRQEKQNVTLHDDALIGNITKYDGGMLNTPCRASVMEDDDDNDWMHTNLNYQRANLNCQQGTVHVQHIHDMQGQERFLPRSYISGQSTEMKGVYSPFTNFVMYVDCMSFPCTST